MISPAPQPAERKDDVESLNDSTNSMSTICDGTYSKEHPEGTEIRRQAEFYLSDENLPHDAHLLAKLEEGNGLITIRHVCGFPKMRKFKPYTSVVASLKRSDTIEVVDNKYIRRRKPLSIRPTVVPKIAEDRQKKEMNPNKPWETKGMLQPTGFEETFAESPLTPAEYDKDRSLYDPEIPFTDRIEAAVQRYAARRKMHQNTLAIFMGLMNFGGIDCGPRQFTGGIDEKFLEDHDKEDVAALKSILFVSSDAHDKEKYVVDFESVAKGFLSTQFTTYFDWETEQQVNDCTNILRNFYNYLLHHDVCPEYASQIHAARKICDQAEQELPKLKQASKFLPGDFNKAVSTLHDGNFAGLYASSNSWGGAADVGFSQEDAKLIMMAGVAALGTEEQYEHALAAVSTGFVVASEELVGFEVVSVEFADVETKELYEQGRLKNTILRTLGKLHGKRWTPPHAPLEDLPRRIADQKKTDTFAFWVEEYILDDCVVGMKMEATVKEFDIGIKWIDSIQASYASFFQFLANERIRDWKEPGPPRSWMVRQVKSDGVDEQHDQEHGDEMQNDELE